MGGTFNIMEARTKTELRKKVRKFTSEAKAMGFDVRQGWDPTRVEKTKDGYRITVSAHS